LRCTYRLQLGPDLGFRAARQLVPYLDELGVSHLYLSPSLQARAGSTHGYDVVDPTRISEDLGGEDEFRALCSAGLGVVLDIVPNHMAASEDENPFWRDPLWRAKFFDLDWRTGSHRRFFDVGELAGVRQEDPEVFETVHAKVLSLVREGLVDGLRIDHPDGLANPARYLERLAEAGAEHVWVEKILEPGERLRDWPVEGTTGYEFLNEVTALFVDPAGEVPLTRLYRELTGEERPFEVVAKESKLVEARGTFAGEVDQLAASLELEAGAVEKVSDTFSPLDLASALASLPVYRTYVDPDRELVTAEDRAALAAAGLDEGLVRILTLEERGHDAFVIRFQQTTPPVHAKGVEDTAFYRWHRLTALNEVGGDPGRFSLSVAEFHRGNLERAERFPRHLLSTMTHDAKRSADVRARIGALAGVADEWAAAVERWRSLTGGWRDANEEYFVWQTLIGAWPLDHSRLATYLEKALREAKVNTAWVDGDPDWEREAIGWATGLLRDERFLADFEPFARQVAEAGRRASLGQVLLKLTCPGVPDVYQGDELELLALVDPDNRRPVDWEARRRALASPEPGSKLDVVRRTLALRRRRPGAFAGAYEQLDAGPDVCAFTRGGEVCVAVAVRATLDGFRLPAGAWEDVLPPSPWLRLLERR
jgi:(1->4)-alpha-D-glucan 1-alpha-D-glucosylmutase